MTLSRHPRFKRSEIGSFQLTERDQEIIRLIHRHRFLRSTHVVALIGSSQQQILRRLKLLYHHGYLERPRAQIDYYHKGGSRHIVYGLGNKSVSLLKQEGQIVLPETSWNEKNQSVGRIFLEHALLVSDIMVAIELSCRSRRIRLLTEEELLPAGMRLFRWRVKVNGGMELSIVPDRMFALEIPEGNGQTTRRIFCLEADRGTMPVKRAHLYQTSFYRKLLAYEATWRQKIHERRFGWNRFRVLTVTTGLERIENIRNTVRSLSGGHGLFLFLDRKKLSEEADFLAQGWQTCQAREIVRLLD